MHFASSPDHGMALVRLNIAMGPMPPSSKYTCTSFNMAGYKFIKHEFNIAQTFQLGSTGMEGSSLDQVGQLNEQAT